MILDGMLWLTAALQAGPRRGPSGDASGDGDRSGGRSRRAAVIWIVLAGAAVVVGTVLLVAAFLRSSTGLAPLGVASPPPAVGSPPAAATDPTASPSPAAVPEPVPSAAGAAPVEGRPAAPPTRTRTPPPATPVPLTARYAATEGGQGLLGYGATVTIANPGRVPVDGWLLTVTLPRPTLTVTDVRGATARGDGATWTFTPDGATNRVPAGGTVRVSFQVRGATLVAARPTACTIDGSPCAGLP
jgi:hypothetical protein